MFQTEPVMKRRKDYRKMSAKYLKSLIRKEIEHKKLSDCFKQSYLTSTGTSTLPVIAPQSLFRPSTSTIPHSHIPSISFEPNKTSELCSEKDASMEVAFASSLENCETSELMMSQSSESSAPAKIAIPTSLELHEISDLVVSSLSETVASSVVESTTFTENLNNWALECNIAHSAFNKLLVILKNVDNVIDLKLLPADCRTLLKTHKTSSIVNTGSGHYYHFGLQEGLSRALKNQSVLSNQIIYFDINIDGLPLTKSSTSQFWPVLGSLCSEKTPFVIGIWHGFKKPEHPKEVLELFVTEYLDLKRDRISYKNERFDICLSKVICDAPAKSFILCTKGHNSYFGCTKCVTEGTYINNRMCYNNLNAPLRTNIDFRSGHYGEDYHTGISPLLQLEIDIVKNIPLDYMHLVCLGVMKRLLQFWVRGNMLLRINKDDFECLNQMILDIRSHISYNDFARLPRPLHDLDRWKASEYRQFLLYTGPILLKDRLKPSQYMHFLSLHCAIRILCSPNLCLKKNNYAKDLLVYFVKNYPHIYGEEYVTHNVHSLIHLPEDVLIYGPLDSFSAFKYENYMREIKRKVKTCNLPLQQFINREYESITYKKNVEISKNVNEVVLNYISRYRETLLNCSLVKSYKWLRLKEFKLGINNNNNHCLIKGNFVIKIVKIIQCQENNCDYIVYQRYLNYEPFYTQPCSSMLVYGGSVTNLSEVKEVCKIDEIVTKCVQYKNVVINYIV